MPAARAASPFATWNTWIGNDRDWGLPALRDQALHVVAEGAVAHRDLLLGVQRLPDLVERPAVFERMADFIALRQERGEVPRDAAGAGGLDPLRYPGGKGGHIHSV